MKELDDLKVGFTSGSKKDTKYIVWTRQKLIWLLAKDGASMGSQLYLLVIKHIIDVHKCLMPKRVGASSIGAYMHHLKSGKSIFFDVRKPGRCNTGMES